MMKVLRYFLMGNLGANKHVKNQNDLFQNGTDRFSMDQTTHQEELRTGVEVFSIKCITFASRCKKESLKKQSLVF